MDKKQMIDNQEYIATDKDGKKYKGVYNSKYDVFFCVYPAFTLNQEPNSLISFEEVEGV